VLEGQIIGGKYRITERLGQGGMGTVFEAVHLGTGGRVALKIIVSAELKDEVLTRFQREARAAGTIDSAHIVRVFDTGIDDKTGCPYMAMERLTGEDLSSLSKRVGPLPPDAVLRIIAQACIGLSKAHEVGVVHRDIKPANIFLADGDANEVVVKILDFGIAKIKMDKFSSADDGLTRTGSMLGSPHYMSPEQAQGLRTIDHRTDIWSLGVVMYKALTGRTPYSNVEALGQVILAICSQPPRPVQEMAPWVPPEVAAIVHRAIRQNPAERFQTAMDMFEAIRPLLTKGRGMHRHSLRPVPAEQRSQVAQQLAMSQPPQRAALPLVAGGTLENVDGNPSYTHAGVASPPQAPPRRSAATWVLLTFLAMTVVAAAAFVGVVALRKPPQVTTTTSNTGAANGTSTPTTVKTTQEPTKPTADPAMTVSITVSPVNATVEIDGVKVEPSAPGEYKITGAPGSKHKVKLTSGKQETSADVVVTSDGAAMPDKITLVTAPSATAVRPVTQPVANTGRPGTTGTAKPAGSGELKPANFE
jgi:serine/threonine-protein kinase